MVVYCRVSFSFFVFGQAHHCGAFIQSSMHPSITMLFIHSYTKELGHSVLCSPGTGVTGVTKTLWTTFATSHTYVCCTGLRKRSSAITVACSVCVCAEELRQAVVDGNCYLVERALACTKPYNLDLPDNKGYTLLMNAVLGGRCSQYNSTAWN